MNSPAFAAGTANLASLFQPLDPAPVRVNPAQAAQAALLDEKRRQLQQRASAEAAYADALEGAGKPSMGLPAAAAPVARETAPGGPVAGGGAALTTPGLAGAFQQPRGVNLGSLGAAAVRAGMDPDALALANLFDLSPEQRERVQLTARGPIGANEYLSAAARDEAAALKADASLAEVIARQALANEGALDVAYANIDAEADTVAAQAELRRAQAEAARLESVPGGSRLVERTPGGFVERVPALASAADIDPQNVIYPDGSTELVDMNNPEAVEAARLKGGQRYTKRQQAATTGELTRSQRGKQVADLQEREIALETARATAEDLKAAIAENPMAIGASGGFSRASTSFVSQAENFANLIGFNIDASLDPDDYNAAFERAKDKLPTRVAKTAIDSAIMRSNITSLAYAAAAASGQSGRDVSNRDVERFIEEIGGATNNPAAFAAVLDEFVGRLERNLQIRESVINRRSERSATEPGVVIDYDIDGNRIGEGVE